MCNWVFHLRFYTSLDNKMFEHALYHALSLADYCFPVEPKRPVPRLVSERSSTTFCARGCTTADTRFSHRELKNEVENTLLSIPLVHGFFSHSRLRYEPCGAADVPNNDPTACVARDSIEPAVVGVLVETVVLSMVVLVLVALFTSVTVVVGVVVVLVVVAVDVPVVVVAVVVVPRVVVDPVVPRFL
jgi:hypothetical protein